MDDWKIYLALHNMTAGEPKHPDWTFRVVQNSPDEEFWVMYTGEGEAVDEDFAAVAQAGMGYIGKEDAAQEFSQASLPQPESRPI